MQRNKYVINPIIEDLERLPDTEQSAYRTETAANATLPSTGKMLEEI